MDVGGGSARKVVNNLADMPEKGLKKLTENADKAFHHLNEYHGVDQFEFRQQVHRFKQDNGLRGDFNLTFGPTGDVWNRVSGDHLGQIKHRG